MVFRSVVGLGGTLWKRPQLQSPNTASFSWASIRHHYARDEFGGMGMLDTIVGFATVIGVIGALGFNFVQMLRTRNQSRDAAQRAENAAALTIEYSERQLDALRDIAGSIRAGGGAHARLSEEARGVRWTLRHHSGDSYLLTNEGDETARSVQIHTDESLGHDIISGQDDLQPGEAIHFMAAQSMATRDSTVTVTWMSTENEPEQWRYPLPPRPPR